jgi:hypothetical protein
MSPHTMKESFKMPKNNADIGALSGSNTPSSITPGAVIYLGAFFGLITLLGLAAFAYLASVNSNLCSSFSFHLLAAAFALGAALAGGFIGGGAVARGETVGTGFNLFFSLAGGAALLIVTLVVFLSLAPKGCEPNTLDQMTSARAELVATQETLASVRAELQSMTEERDTASAANTTARAELKRLVAQVEGAFPGTGNLSAALSRVNELIAQSCRGGSHGVDPQRAPEMRAILGGAVTGASSAHTALTNAVASVPAELRN